MFIHTDQLVTVGEAAGKLRVFDLSFDWSQPYGLWAGLIGGLFITLGSHGVDQMMVQRYLCAKNLREAQRALWVGGFVIVAQFALFLVIGVGLFAYYQTHPLAGQALELFEKKGDRIFPIFIVQVIPLGLKGLIIAAVFAAAISSLMGILTALSQTCMSAFYNPLRERHLRKQGIEVEQVSAKQFAKQSEGLSLPVS